MLPPGIFQQCPSDSAISSQINFTITVVAKLSRRPMLSRRWHSSGSAKKRNRDTTNMKSFRFHLPCFSLLFDIVVKSMTHLPPLPPIRYCAVLCQLEIFSAGFRERVELAPSLFKKNCRLASPTDGPESLIYQL